MIEVGEDVKDLKPDDYIIFSTFAVTQLQVDDEDLYFINEAQIVAAIEDAE